MALSSDLISQFVKVTKDDTKTSTESTVYGTTVNHNGEIWVQLDGSELYTPVSKTTNVEVDERVTVMIKDHTATITGNITSPSARTQDVEDLGEQVTIVENLVADTITTEELEAELAHIDELIAGKITTEEFEAEVARIDELVAGKITTEEFEAELAEIENLVATKISTDVLEANYAKITALEAVRGEFHELQSTYGHFSQLTADRLDAAEARIDKITASDITTEYLETNYAQIDFANIGEAAIEELFAKSGMIEDLLMSDGHVTGMLVGVKIKGDLIEGETIYAKNLILEGEDGLFYRLNTDGITVEAEQTTQNSLDGSVIAAKSITATKIAVDDLYAFGATIGGINIAEGALHSEKRGTVDSDLPGFYMDSEGQFSVGMGDNFLKFYAVYSEDGTLEDYVFEVSSVSRLEDELDGMFQTNNTELISTANNMILAASESLVQVSEYETFKSDVNNRLDVNAKDISMTFESTTEQINNVSGDLQAKFTELYKYIKFSGETAITIGSGDNSVVLEIDNEKGIAFKKDGVQFGLWDGVDFYTGNIIVKVTERAQLGNFAFVPRTDGSLSFLQVANRLRILSEPYDYNVKVGTSVTLIVTAEGQGLTYQWYDSDDGGETWDVMTTAGATTNTINVTPGVSWRYFWYKCVVSDKFGTTVSTRMITVKGND